MPSEVLRFFHTNANSAQKHNRPMGKRHNEGSRQPTRLSFLEGGCSSSIFKTRFSCGKYLSKRGGKTQRKLTHKISHELFFGNVKFLTVSDSARKSDKTQAGFGREFQRDFQGRWHKLLKVSSTFQPRTSLLTCDENCFALESGVALAIR